MKRIKKQRLEHAGWVVGDSAQFLQLSAEENRFIELKPALAAGVRELRERKGLTQAVLAQRLGSSQSRVAKMEAADRSVSLDLIMRSLLTIGATATDVAKWIKRAESARAAWRHAAPSWIRITSQSACEERWNSSALVSTRRFVAPHTGHVSNFCSRYSARRRDSST